MPTTVSQPKIDDRPAQFYVGIRRQTPMKGMFKVVDKLMKDLQTWVKQEKMMPCGSPFLRYHVIDMEGELPTSTQFMNKGE